MIESVCFHPRNSRQNRKDRKLYFDYEAKLKRLKTKVMGSNSQFLSCGWNRLKTGQEQETETSSRGDMSMSLLRWGLSFCSIVVARLVTLKALVSWNEQRKPDTLLFLKFNWRCNKFKLLFSSTSSFEHTVGIVYHIFIFSFSFTKKKKTNAMFLAEEMEEMVEEKAGSFFVFFNFW